MLHAAAKLFNACGKLDSEETSKTKSSAKNSRLVLHLPVVTLIGSGALVHPETHNEKGEVTKHTLAENQHPLEMSFIVYYLHEHKLQADSILT